MGDRRWGGGGFILNSTHKGGLRTAFADGTRASVRTQKISVCPIGEPTLMRGQARLRMAVRTADMRCGGDGWRGVAQLKDMQHAAPIESHGEVQNSRAGRGQ